MASYEFPVKKKKPASAEDQANAIENTNVLGAGQGTSAGVPQTTQQVADKAKREKGQEVLDKDKYTMKTPQTTSAHVVANYTGFGMGGAATVDRLAKQGMTTEQIVKKMGLKPNK